MSDIEVDNLVKRMTDYSIRLSKSKKKSKEFLIGAGIIDTKGKLTENFKHLCIPPEQA